MLCPCCNSAVTLSVRGNTTPAACYGSDASYAITNKMEHSMLDIFRCTACGHGFSVLSEQDNTLLIEWYKRAGADALYQSEEKGRRYTGRRVLERLDAFKKPPGVLLDVGCGQGYFLREAVAHGWDAQGLEVATWAIDAAGDIRDRIQMGNVQSLAAHPAESVDVVSAFDVVEHLVDPFSTLTAFQRILKPRGVLVLTLPRFDCIAARILKKRWHCMHPAHIHYFSRKSLHASLKRAGFTVVHEKSHTRYFSAAYLVRHLLKIHFVHKPGQTRMLFPINVGDEFEIYAMKND